MNAEDAVGALTPHSAGPSGHRFNSKTRRSHATTQGSPVAPRAAVAGFPMRSARCDAVMHDHRSPGLGQLSRIDQASPRTVLLRRPRGFRKPRALRTNERPRPPVPTLGDQRASERRSVDAKDHMDGSNPVPVRVRCTGLTDRRRRIAELLGDGDDQSYMGRCAQPPPLRLPSSCPPNPSNRLNINEGTSHVCPIRQEISRYWCREAGRSTFDARCTQDADRRRTAPAVSSNRRTHQVHHPRAGARRCGSSCLLNRGSANARHLRARSSRPAFPGKKEVHAVAYRCGIGSAGRTRA